MIMKITRDCYTCRWAIWTAQGVICTSIWYGFMIRNLLVSAPFPCDGWENVRKLVSEHERIV